MSRTLRRLAVLAVVALIAAACSNAPAETGTGSSSDTTATSPTGMLAATSTSTDGGNKNSGTTASESSPESVASTGSSGSTSTAATRAQAVKFAQCMRANGVKQFPDPDASGQLTIDAIANGSSLDSNSAAFKQAISACKDLEPPGFTGGKRSPEQQKAALKFAQCIRDNGVKDFPDPDPNGPLIDTNRIPSTAQKGGVSILNAAMRKCRGFATGAGVTGGQ